MTLSEYSLYLTRLIIDQHINLPQVIKANATGVFFEECSSHMRLEEKWRLTESARVQVIHPISQFSQLLSVYNIQTKTIA